MSIFQSLVDEVEKREIMIVDDAATEKTVDGRRVEEI